jgi:hypothetical protein
VIQITREQRQRKVTAKSPKNARKRRELYLLSLAFFGALAVQILSPHYPPSRRNIAEPMKCELPTSSIVFLACAVRISPRSTHNSAQSEA